MAKTLVIHIGGHKTGSTTIQEAFASGQVQLKNAKIQYPARLDHNYLRSDILSHINGTPLPKRGPRLLSFAQLAQRIQNNDAAYTLISAEYLETVDPDVLKEIVEQHFSPVVDHIKIVAYVRPHASRLMSGYSEALKIGWFQGDLAGFLTQTVQDKTMHYAQCYTKWRAAFGENLILRPMVSSELTNASVLDDFMDTAFAGETVTQLPEQIKNQSLDAKDLAFVQLLQEQFQSHNDWFKHTFGWEVARQLQAVPRDPASTIYTNNLPRDVADALVDTYADDATDMDQTFFGGANLFTNALYAAQASAISAPSDVTTEAVLDENMLRNIKTLRALLGDVFQTPHNWSAHFHGGRIKDLEKTPTRMPQTKGI